MQQPEISLPARYVAGRSPAGVGFDYSALKPADAAKLREVADTIRTYEHRLTKQILTIGELLLAVKAGLEHGAFGAWLATEFHNWNERSAQRYMQAAQVFGSKSDIVSVLPPTTIYALSSPSTPEPVRVAVVERLESGERPSPAAIKEMMDTAKASEKEAMAASKLSAEEKAKKRKAQERELRDREKRRQESEDSMRRESQARRDAAALIVERLGDDVPRLLELLDVGRSLHAADIRDITAPTFASRLMANARA